MQQSNCKDGAGAAAGLHNLQSDLSCTILLKILFSLFLVIYTWPIIHLYPVHREWIMILESNRWVVQKKCQRWLCNSPWLLFLQTYLHQASHRAVFPWLFRFVLCLGMKCYFLRWISCRTSTKWKEHKYSCKHKFAAVLFQPFFSYFSPDHLAVSLFLQLSLVESQFCRAGFKWVLRSGKPTA